MTTAEYRPEIDGLRAIAVLGVVAYHFGLPVTGGFVGVDVFFVVSGYLITLLLVREVEATGRIDLTDFYLRRIRRLLPALTVTVALTFAVAVRFSPPDALLATSKSALAALLGLANVWFSSQSGYFEPANLSKVLLHTWSLGIEQQFYLLWPLILLVGGRLRIPMQVLAGAIVVLSLAASVAYLSDQASIYFLLPFRAFELAIGACVVWIERHRLGDGMRAATFAAGLLLIVGSMALLSSRSVFPSYNALWPCLGAALVIYAGRSRAAFLLFNRPVVWVGRISYSLYLVHWPILIFWEAARAPLTVFDRIAIGAVTLASAVALYYLVEQPFRRHRQWIQKPAAILALILIVAPVGHAATSGWPWRYSAQLLALLEQPPRATHPGCFIGPGTDPLALPEACYWPPSDDGFSVLLAGDSTADHLYPGLVEALGPAASIYSWTASVCPPIENYADGRFENCSALNRVLFDRLLPSGRYDLVVFAAYDAPAWAGRFAQTAETMNRLAIPYILIGETITFVDAPNILVGIHGSTEGIPAYLAARMLDSCSAEHGLDLYAPEHFFSVKERLCRDGAPIAIIDGQFLNVDKAHYSIAGSRFVATALVEWLKGRCSPATTTISDREPLRNMDSGTQTADQRYAPPRYCEVIGESGAH